MTLISNEDVRFDKSQKLAMTWRCCFFSLLVITICLPNLGCRESGPEIAEVAGTITLKGKPASELVVSFIPDSGGRTSAGPTDSGGGFRLIYNPRTAGAIVGGHTVHIALEGEKVKLLTGSSRPVALSKKVEVASGGNQFSFALEDFAITEK